MRITYLLGQFPTLSETFVINQITALIGFGHELRIASSRRPESMPPHRAIEAWQLDERTDYLNSLRARLLARPRPSLRQTARLCAAAPLLLGWPGPRLWGPRRLLSAAHYFTRYSDADVVVVHFGPQAYVAGQLLQAGIIRVPVVAFFHAYDLTMLPRRHGRDVYAGFFRHRLAYSLAISQHGLRMLDGLGVDRRRAQLLRLGAQMDTRACSSVRRHGGSPSVVLSVGRLIPKKGFEDGISALARLRAVGVGPDRLVYRIVGTGPGLERLRAAAQTLGVADQVELLGALAQEAVLEQLGDADLLLAPSVSTPDGDEEGIPVAIMEAMAARLPVVSTRHAGIPELVREGSGQLVEEHDVDGLASAIHGLLDEPAARARMGLVGRAIVEADFNLERQNRALAALLADVIAGRFGPRRD